MKPSEFLDCLDDKAITDAIAEAESRTSGQIRVYVSERLTDNAQERAKCRFDKLGMRETRDRNAILLYFAPRIQRFAVVGDSGIHSKCGQPFWEELAAQIQADLRTGKFHEALLGAIVRCGELLARHFPRREDGTNELPNEILRD
ncbi:MAG: hypothetical protein JWL59_2696 [Chthoniobacteraceae bacterium]|nr:hypothetical protein [Chthoniobacteraceae bacterium]